MAKDITAFLGCKFYKYTDPEDRNSLVVYRLIGLQNSETSKVVNIDTKETLKVKSAELMSDYRIIRADGVITASIVSCNISQEADKRNMMDDVVVCLYTMKDLEGTNEKRPYCVCRQNINDVFNEYMNSNPIPQAGCCISRDDVPSHINYDILTFCDEVGLSIVYNVYLDDDLDDIMMMIRNTKFDSTIKNIHDKWVSTYGKTMELTQEQINGASVYGYCTTLRQLLLENNFMYDFYAAFGIQKVPFEMKVNENWEMIPALVTEFSNMVRKNIKKVFVVPFSKDIDFEKIKMDYYILRDEKGRMYVVAYIEDGQFVEDDAEAIQATKALHDYAELMHFGDKYKTHN